LTVVDNLLAVTPAAIADDATRPNHLYKEHALFKNTKSHSKSFQPQTSHEGKLLL
jgi:hypothetical protein